MADMILKHNEKLDVRNILMDLEKACAGTQDGTF